MSPHRRESFVLALATGLVGVTFGVFADSAGFSLAQAMVLSSLTFTGASQFAAVSVIGSGGTPLAAVGSALLLAARNSLYGPVVAPLLRTKS
ncbi:MAG: AzlC family ABC transporter permease, partial [Actinobacteria bacterium]|nr:AzlC family ABC transporter permease [Actinomycetota bacterium]